MIVYFSGTGNSRWCAELLADKLSDQYVDAFELIKESIAVKLTSSRPWVFVAPTYAWQLPRIFADFIRRGSFSGSRDAYFVMTCGSDIGSAQTGNQALCLEKSLRCRGTLQVVMPENYIAMFPVPDAAEARIIIDAARPVLERGVACIQEGMDFPALKIGAADKLKSGVVNSAFYKLFIRAKPFTVSEACTDCGNCSKSCVLNNIRLIDGKPIWGGSCTHCMACISICPTSAIEYGKASRGRPRYRCPKYKG